MWLTFFAACAVLVVISYCTTFMLRAFGFSWVASVACAPIASILLYSLMAAALHKIGVFCNWKLLFIPVCVVSMVAYATTEVARRRDGITINAFLREGNTIALYAVVGLVVGLIVFVLPLDGTECFTQTYDDVTHLSLVRSMLESGNYSSLAVTTSPDFADEAAGGYYPAAFHMLTAMVMGALNTSVPLATNATCYIIASLMYPLSCLALMKALFPQDKTVVAMGSVACVCSVIYPWYFLIYGKLSANLIGYALAPAIAACFILLLEKNHQTSKIKMACLYVTGLVSCVFTQPNVVFLLMVFLGAYCIYKIAALPSQHYSFKRKTSFVVGFCALFVLIWAAFFVMPFMQPTVTFFWSAVSTKTQAVADVLFNSTPYIPSAVLVSLLALAGVLMSLKHRQYLWLVAPCVIAALIYVVCAATNSGLKNILGGFWYTDQNRISAMLVMFEMPLVSLGAATVMRKIKTCISVKKDVIFTNSVCCLASLLLVVAMFVPSFSVRGIGDVQTQFGYFEESVSAIYSTTDEWSLFNAKEREFTAKAYEITKDAKVINSPYDGSIYAYALTGIHTYYRSPLAPEQGDRYTIRLNLYEYATNFQVRQAVENMGAEYVLLLEPKNKTGDLFPAYNEQDWSGIDSITDDTPGFEVVLSEGNMRLYRIVD